MIDIATSNTCSGRTGQLACAGSGAEGMNVRWPEIGFAARTGSAWRGQIRADRACLREWISLFETCPLYESRMHLVARRFGN